MIQPDLVSKLLRSTYVDDIVTGAESEEAAYELYKESKELLKGAGFNLRKFTSNSSRLHDKVEREETHTPLMQIPPHQCRVTLTNQRRPTREPLWEVLRHFAWESRRYWG